MSTKQYMRQLLLQERQQPTPALPHLQQTIDNLAQQALQLKKKLKNLKNRSKQRQQEIDSWYLWFQSIEAVEKSEEKAEVLQQVGWRRDEITSLQHRIPALYQQLNEIELALLTQQAQHEAIQQGIHELPIEQDPRLAELLTEDLTQRQANNV